MGYKDSDVSISRLLSRVLRHDPEYIGLKIEREGAWADTKELLDKLSKKGVSLDMERLERIVREDSKQRYSFNGDKTKIRANQGHSIDVSIPMEIKTPPEVLYHGTSSESLDSIRKNGIMSMKRQYVHLSKDIETAAAVGSRHTRHSGSVAVLVIDTAGMVRDGHVFRLSDNGVWQSETVAWEYVKEILYP